MPTSPGAYSRNPPGPGWWHAYFALLDLAETGLAQLRYGTYLDGTGGTCWGAWNRALPDELGDAVLVGRTSCGVNFPTTAGGYQQTFGGGGDLVVAKVSLLPRGVGRFGHSVPACQGPIRQTVNSWPQAGNPTFRFEVCGAPPGGAGLIAFGFPDWTGTPLPGFGVNLFLGYPARSTMFRLADAQGHADFPLPIPSVIPATPPHGFATQWFFLTTPACPGIGPVASSEGLSW